MLVVPLLTGAIDVDTVVAILMGCMTEAAQQLYLISTLKH